jgi:AcrR family transcriptional regulator
MTEYASRGDPRRTMALLWGRVPAPSRGPKPGIDVSEIVAAAIAIADAEGLEAVSMRRVAERLGRSAMSLYTYVPGKGELLDLMLDTTLGELPVEYPRDGGWRAAIEASARAAWAFYQRHPWVLQVAGARPVLGPHEIDVYESHLRLFDDLGLSAVEMVRSAAVVSSFVRGAASALADARAAEQATGQSDDAWWSSRAPLLEELAGEEWIARHPTLVRLQGEGAFDQLDRPDPVTPYTVQEALDTFEFGLQRLLDGLEALVSARR